MSSVKFKLNKPNARIEILAGNQKFQNTAYNAMLSLLPVIEAKFLLDFGRVGRFYVTEFLTDRYTAAVRSKDARTTAILKMHPRWLEQFIDNIRI
jgi:hypothetical protein